MGEKLTKKFYHLFYSASTNHS